MGATSPKRYGSRVTDQHDHTTQDQGGPVAAAATKEVFFNIASRGTAQPYNLLVGANDEWPVSQLNANQEANFLLHVPNDFTSLTDLVVVMIPDATETIGFDVNLASGAAGDDFETVTNAIVAGSRAVFLEEITEVDISSVFSGLVAGDYAGIIFASNTANERIVGLRLRYS